MPIRYTICPELNLVFIVVAGFYSLSELIEQEEVFSKHPDRQPNMKLLIDVGKAELDISLDDVKKAIAMNQARLDKGKELEATAVISANKFHQVFGDAYRLLGEGLPLKLGIFTTLSDAISWLEMTDNKEKILEIQKDLQGQTNSARMK